MTTKSKLYTGCLVEVVTGQYDGYLGHVIGVSQNDILVTVHIPDQDDILIVLGKFDVKLKYG